MAFDLRKALMLASQMAGSSDKRFDHLMGGKELEDDEKADLDSPAPGEGSHPEAPYKALDESAKEAVLSMDANHQYPYEHNEPDGDEDDFGVDQGDSEEDAGDENVPHLKPQHLAIITSHGANNISEVQGDLDHLPVVNDGMGSNEGREPMSGWHRAGDSQRDEIDEDMVRDVSSHSPAVGTSSSVTDIGDAHESGMGGLSGAELAPMAKPQIDSAARQSGNRSHGIAETAKRRRGRPRRPQL